MNNTKHSNCLLEALKAKLRSRGKAKIHQIGKWSWIWKKRCFPHFYWTIGGSMNIERDFGRAFFKPMKSAAACLV